MADSNLNLGRDDQGIPPYTLNVERARKYNQAFTLNVEVYVPLQDTDKYVIFLPALGANYRISSDPNPVMPAVGVGLAMLEANTVVNVAAIALDGWLPSATAGDGSRRLYITVDLSVNMTILVF